MLCTHHVFGSLVVAAIILVPLHNGVAETVVSDREPSSAAHVPDGWDPALAGDLVMRRLVRVTAPSVKGAHDSEFTLVNDYAYIVAELSDQRAGESAAWPEIYCALSIVNLETLAVEAILPYARSEQAFTNEALPIGACFVPRIRQINNTTLRCYFASEQPGVRQSQTWFRDFDLHAQTFSDTIHNVKLKTAAGTFDMQPRFFHADAVANGFAKPAKDFGCYLFDGFKTFDNKTYVALNNFPGKQNALAIAHDDFATFEVVGHFNEPQSAQLSESAVNQLPDGSWMAICRNDGGNYYFQTSEDGKSWTGGRELPFVPNGANSKPTFDKFGGTYYLGWQEDTRIHGVSRSVFNINISRDGKSWTRKYRFETTQSFQYPSFHEHDGTIWLSVTQGDASPSRKERIMFGKLETVGEFASQVGKKRKSIAAPAEQVAVLQPGVKLFTDRDYTLTEAPAFLIGRSFVRTSIDGFEIQCVKPGEVFAMTLSKPHAANQSEKLLKQGFTKVDTPEFQLFPGVINRVFAYRKALNSGDRLRFDKTTFLVLGEATQIKSNPTKGKLRSLISRPMAKKIAKMTEAESRQGFVELFDGETFDGWQQDGNWRIEDGAFVRVSDGGPLTYKRKNVPDDFELRFDWKVSKGCNSGVYYRPGQVEYQVLDNIDSPYGENPRQAAASLFFCMAPSKEATRPVGEWNSGRVVCKGTVIQHWLNGEKVLDFDYTDPKWAEWVQLLTIRGGDLTGRDGELWLQDHGHPVWYRNLRWREIPTEERLRPSPDFKPMPIPPAALAKEQQRVQKMLKQAQTK